MQANLSLHWEHMSEGMFSRFAFHMVCCIESYMHCVYAGSILLVGFKGKR